MLSDDLIREIVRDAIAKGTPKGDAMRLEVALFNARFTCQAAIRRANRHGEVLAMVDRCGGNVASAAERLELTTRAVYLHLENKLKSPA